MKEFFKKNWKWILCFALVFCCALVLPFSGDDFDWGAKSLSDYGSLLVDTELNGRYVGNFLVILITKNAFIRAFATALVLVGIVYVIKKETDVPNSFIWLGVLTMPLSIFVQGITWASGFTNYTISTLLLLLVLTGLRKIYADEATTGTIIRTIVLVFLTSFFLENITIFLVLITAAVNIIYFIKKKKVNPAAAVALGTAILGTFLMFIQPTYHNVFAGEDFYRSFAGNIKDMIVHAIINYVYFMHEYIAFENVILLAAISGASYAYFKKNQKDYSAIQQSILNVSFCYSLAFICFTVLNLTNPEWGLPGYSQLYINAGLAGIYIVILVSQIILLFYKKKSFVKVLLPLVCIVGIVAPLFLVTPVGPRNFFVVYILEVIETFYIMREAEFEFKKYERGALVVCAVLLIYYTSIYSVISFVNLQRDNYIKHISEDTNETVAVVPLVPFNSFVHYDDFSDKWSRPKYNKRMNIRENLTYEFVLYGDWVERMEEAGYVIRP